MALDITCAMISSVDLAHYSVSRAKEWVSLNCGTIICDLVLFILILCN